jgi:hypothetical protein
VQRTEKVDCCTIRYMHCMLHVAAARTTFSVWLYGARALHITENEAIALGDTHKNTNRHFYAVVQWDWTNSRQRFRCSLYVIQNWTTKKHKTKKITYKSFWYKNVNNVENNPYLRITQKKYCRTLSTNSLHYIDQKYFFPFLASFNCKTGQWRHFI